MTHTVDILMPRLSDSMHEGTIIQWLKGVGDTVRMGEDLVEIETDKAQMTYGADIAGTLVEIVAEEGVTVPLGEPIARIEVEGDGPAAEPAAETATAEAPASEPASEPVVDTGLEKAYEQNFSHAASSDERVSISPVARRMAEEQGVNYNQLDGSGPNGRVVLSDVEAALQASAAPVAPAAPAQAPTAPAAGDIREATRLERLIARRMVLGKSAPEFPSSRDVRVDELLLLRAQMKREGVEPLPSVNDFIVKAVALSLKSHPLLCSGWQENNWQDDHAEIIRHDHIHIGVAVATEESLIVPVVKDADQLSLGSLAAHSKQLALQARAGKIAPAELEGAVFTISNLGGMGVDRFQAILVPGQAGILAVGAARPEVRWGEQGPEPHTLLSLTLTADHRLVYGSHAAAFLADLAEFLENPTRLLI